MQPRDKHAGVMTRFALLIEYDGTGFAGWQRQADVLSVQEVVEAAFLPIEPAPVTIQCAGRTDAGVHGLGQVAHCDLAGDWDGFKLAGALNYHMKPHRVAVLEARAVGPEFSARFDAVQRHYVYRLQSRRAPLALDHGRVWSVGYALDEEPMREAAQHLVGTHDFTTFRSVQCQSKSPVKSIDAVRIDEVAVNGGREYQVRISARSFLHNQVRSIVGTLERVGAGRWSVERFADALDRAERSACGPVAPPEGLYLERVDYAEAIFGVDLGRRL